MHFNHQLRESLLQQADEAYLGLMKQVDNLLSIVGFCLERHLDSNPSARLRARELVRASVLLGTLGTNLAVTLTNLKLGLPRAQLPMETELATLNEIWANVQALVYVIKSEELDTEPFEHDQAAIHFATLVSTNRLRT